ncbi:MAG: glycosyltransferase [bacterium]|nr:glycosyltransferase [bacterium]
MTIILINRKTGGGAEKIANLIAEKLKINIIFLDEDIIKIKFKPIKILLHIYAIIKLALYIKTKKIKSVLSFLERSNIINIITSFLTGHKAIVSVRINIIKEYEKFPFYIKFAKFIYKKSYKIIAVSNGVKQMLESMDIDKEKIEVIHNAVEVKYSNTLPDNIITGIGRLERQKNFELLIKAFSLLNVSKYKLIICGVGSMYKKLSIMIEKLCLKDSVILKGWCNVGEILLKTKVFVLSSLWEGFPNAMLEAMAYGVPIVAVNANYGVSEILEDGKYGLICEYDPIDMKRKIELLINDEKLWQEYSKASKIRAQAFNVDTMLEKYKKYILC